MSKQLIFSALIGLPTTALLAMNRAANGSWWAVMWIAFAASHVWFIVEELRSRAKREGGK